MSASALIKRIGNISNKAKMESFVQVRQLQSKFDFMLYRTASGHCTAVIVTHARYDTRPVGATR